MTPEERKRYLRTTVFGRALGDVERLREESLEKEREDRARSIYDGTLELDDITFKVREGKEQKLPHGKYEIIDLRLRVSQVIEEDFNLPKGLWRVRVGCVAILAKETTLFELLMMRGPIVVERIEVSDEVEFI